MTLADIAQAHPILTIFCIIVVLGAFITAKPKQR